MRDFIDLLIFQALDLHNFLSLHFWHRPAMDWLLFFFPFFIFGELPRYTLPALVLLARRAFCAPRGDRERKRRFLASQPSVSVLLVGLNEEKTVAKAIRSLLEFEYPNLEIIVVDDHSSDRMYEVARPYAERGQIRLFRNSAASGRGGRPSASNLAFAVSRGEFILSVDADTSFDRDTLLHMIGPFYDPRVGVVAGNLKVRNQAANLWTRMQALEYLQSITLWKTWLNLLGWNMQASGAYGAFRRRVLEETGAWDAELAEDADISLKAKKSGWKVVFAPEAIAMTNVPEGLKGLARQRYRWDRGTLRTYYHKHGDLLRFWRYHWSNAAELSLDYFFSVAMSLVYPAWFGWMCWQSPLLTACVLGVSYFAYLASALVSVAAGLALSERREAELHLFKWTFFFPIYKEIFRWVRIYSMLLELLRVNYEDAYLPGSAWRNAPRW